MPKTVTFTDEEIQVAINLLDAAVRFKGLEAAFAANHIAAKIKSGKESEILNSVSETKPQDLQSS